MADPTAEFKAHEATVTLKGPGLNVVYDLIPELGENYMNVLVEAITDVHEAPSSEPDHGFIRYVPGDHHITITLKGRPKP